MSLKDILEMYLFQLLGSCIDEETECENDGTVIGCIDNELARKYFQYTISNAEDFCFFVAISPDNELSIFGEKDDDSPIILATHQILLKRTAENNKQELYKQMITLIRSSATIGKEAV